MRFVHSVAGLSFAVLTFYFCGCASKPALPRRASLDTAGSSDARPDFAATVAAADIVYFPAERAASGARSEPAALLLEAFQTSGTPFGIAWDNISADQQPLLDEIASTRVAAREKLIARLEIGGTGRSREHCRAVLRDTQAGGIRHLALRVPQRSGAGGAPETTEEQSTMHFRPAPYGLETFAERMTAAESLSGRDVASVYRARLTSEQFAAEQIVRFFQTRGIPKLLVFMQTSDLESSDGVPFYVAQKVNLRQVVLGANAPRSSRAKLLTGTGRSNGGRGFQVVDGTPVTGRE
ncbi:MAG: hypothetical protein M3Y69_02440 [Verrucomicrobiota bacterium]|nr:hypothetical protein [Verrucomicrobiota bacterium]